MESKTINVRNNQKNTMKITDWILNFNSRNENDLLTERKPNIFVTNASTKMVVPDITIQTISGIFKLNQ